MLRSGRIVSTGCSRSSGSPGGGMFEPPDVGGGMMDFGQVAREIEQAVGEGAFPGAVVLVARADRVVYQAAFGARSVDPERTPMLPDTVFDLSSLTKPLATTTAFMS